MHKRQVAQLLQAGGNDSMLHPDGSGPAGRMALPALCAHLT
ncbi:hypothetical protein FB99_45420 (plasmid) [Pantoea agglomerans]|nr:hypothetical protein FB99_45420 [Pantoea agglomerans]